MPREYLYLCDELFMCGTAAEVTPIRSVDGRQIGAGKAGPVTRRMQEMFFGLFDGTTPDKHGWLERACRAGRLLQARGTERGSGGTVCVSTGGTGWASAT